MTEIIQSDREAAAKVHPFSHNSALILDGERDGTDIVQAAMHSRLALFSDDRVDEVARAIAKAMGHDYDGPVADDWDIQNDIADAARAVLKTLRGEA